jgi:hypothetical protein
MTTLALSAPKKTSRRAQRRGENPMKKLITTSLIIAVAVPFLMAAPAQTEKSKPAQTEEPNKAWPARPDGPKQ